MNHTSNAIAVHYLSWINEQLREAIIQNTEPKPPSSRRILGWVSEVSVMAATLSWALSRLWNW